MTLAPLLAAPLVIQLHTVAAIAAFGLGAVQLFLPKGTPLHRGLGMLWVALMVGVAGGSFMIHQINQWHGFSLIHLLSIFTLLSLALGVRAARRRHIKSHRLIMTSLFIGAVLIAGLFTFAPGRIMHAVLFGG